MNSILTFVLSCLYLALPGAVANMAPVLSKGTMKFLAVPVDMGKTWRGKPIFGKNKTYRGFVAGMIVAIIVVLLQRFLYRYSPFRSVSLIDYSSVNPYLLGALMGFGVLFGDLIESAVKRRLNLAPGESFFPWDQLDHLIGAMLFIWPVYLPPISVILTLAILAVALHVGIKHIGYWLGIEKTKW